jgi:hypothetical protein
MKRVVTGNSPEGKAVIVSDGLPPRIVNLENLGGIEFIEMWATEETPTLPAPGEDLTPTMKSFVPGPGGTRFRLVKFPPDAVVQMALVMAEDPSGVLQEYIERIPGLAAKHEPTDPAMHVTDTIDYGIVLTGEIWLDLGDGAPLHMKQGDCVVQQGTRHAWRNHTSETCVMAFIMVGANVNQ